MDYCGPRGLPRSKFLGWPKDDQDAAIVWVIRERSVHAACGTRREDWDPEQGGHPRAFVATVDVCPGCAALENRQARFDKQREKGDLEPGSSLVLRRQEGLP
ncbi:hypothetical protein [Pseudonocardia broussonetiae]|uniref:Uncharacterized protein n=1 Tax=Pseudonocardia broussonetiae TaxID=2736640 RepID=A0A6M6JFD3_9PSEU|nr:hypothetical protein [Pseudonocardia broussonetiae]QJY46654.1 hypothetical protein HOP40_13195 [Pseudonocardia broussonetiae]